MQQPGNPLRELYFDGPSCSEPEVNGSVAEALRDNQQVEELTIRAFFIGGTWFGDDEAKELEEELAKHSSLKTFHLSDFTLGPDGLLAIANGIRLSTTITSLSLTPAATLGYDDAKILANVFANSESLEKVSLHEIGSGELRAMEERMQDNTTITSLSLSPERCYFRDDDAKILASVLDNSKSLKHLELGSIISLRERGGYFAFDEPGWGFFTDSLSATTALESLVLMKGEMVGNDGATAIKLADALAPNSSLVTLHLDDCSISVAGASAIADALVGHDDATLRVLSLSGNAIGDGGATALANALAPNSSLVTLHLDDCSISVAGASAIADALVGHDDATLRVLSLSGNPIGDGGATALADALASISSLTTSKLKDCNISDSGASAIADALVGHDDATLRVLSLSGNPIGDDGATAFAEVLESYSSLTSLVLKYCHISAPGASDIADALQHNNTLLKLCLSGNKIEVGGATALGTALAFNSSLTILKLNHCQILDLGDLGLGSSAIGNNLANNTTLQCLEFNYNWIQSDGAKAFSKVLASNTSLKRVDLRICRIDEENARTLGRAWGTSTNSELKFDAYDDHNYDWDEWDYCDDLQELDLKNTNEIILEQAQQVREEILDREKLLAFGMGMHPRLGGQEAHEGDANVGSINHRVQPEIFRQIGHLILDMFDAGH